MDNVQYVQLSRIQSTMRNIPHGIPQGLILGLLVFAIFVNDLPLHSLSDFVFVFGSEKGGFQQIVTKGKEDFINFQKVFDRADKDTLWNIFQT